MRPSGEAPSQPCTQSSRSTRKRQPLTACPVSASYRASAAVSCTCRKPTWRLGIPKPFKVATYPAEADEHSSKVL